MIEDPAPQPCLRASAYVGAVLALAGHRRPRGCRPAAHRCDRPHRRRESRRRAHARARHGDVARHGVRCARAKRGSARSSTRARGACTAGKGPIARDLRYVRPRRNGRRLGRFTKVCDFAGVLRAVTVTLLELGEARIPASAGAEAVLGGAAHAMEALRVERGRYRRCSNRSTRASASSRCCTRASRRSTIASSKAIRAFEHHTGMRDAVGKRMRELAPDHEEHWYQFYGEVVRTRACRSRAVLPAKSLDDRWYEVHAFPFGPPGSHRVAVLFDDISDRMRAEQALRDSEERFRCLANATPSMLWSATSDGAMTWLSDRWSEYTGQGLRRQSRRTQQPDPSRRIARSRRCVAPRIPGRTLRNRIAPAPARRRVSLVPRARQSGATTRRANSPAGTARPPTSTTTSWPKTRCAKWTSARTSSSPRSRTSCAIRSRRCATACTSCAWPQGDRRATSTAAPARRDGAAGRATGAAGRRPAGGLAHHARHGAAAPAGGGAGGCRRARGRNQPAADRCRAPRACVSTCRRRRSCCDADPVRLAQVLSNLLNNAAKYTEPGGRIALEARREGDEAVLVVRDNGLGHRDGRDRARVRSFQPGRAFDRRAQRAGSASA